MLIELILAILLGIILGVITGLIPGIHINLVGAIILSLAAFLVTITSPINLVIFIVAMTITHSFIDFIPSILLGAPEENTLLSVLPGHELLNQGKGYEAIKLATIGNIIGVIIIPFISIIFILYLDSLEPLVKNLIPFILIASVVVLIIKEENKLIALVIFLLTGFLGIVALNSSVREPFLPLLSGLFGASSIILSINNKVNIPKQDLTESKISPRKLVNPILASVVSAPMTSFLPGFGTGQAAIIGSSIVEITKKEFIVLLGIVSSLVTGLSFIVLYVIGRERTGVAVFVNELLPKISEKEILLIILIMLFVGILNYYLTLKISKKAIAFIEKINYRKLSSLVLIIISIIVMIFSGILGFLIFIVSTIVGLFAITSGVKRIHMMGVLIVPVSLWYLV